MATPSAPPPPALPAPLLRSVAEGDADAMQECIERFGNMVWALARRMCPSPSDAEDAVQDIFIELWRKAAAYDPAVAGETTFVAMIARRRLVDRFRRAGRRPSAETLDAAPEPAARTDEAGDLLELGDEAARAAECMQRLSAPQQLVLRMSIFEGLSYPDICNLTDMPLGTVKTHARRGLLRLRELMNVPAPVPTAASRGSADTDIGSGSDAETGSVLPAAGQPVRSPMPVVRAEGAR